MRLPMKYRTIVGVAALSLLAVGCGQDSDKNVISQRYIHKYGYDVSRDEW